MFQTKVVEKIKTHSMFNNFFFPENLAFYEIMWKNFVEPGIPQMTIWCLRIAFWIPKATNTHSEYLIFICLPLQQWLHERASINVTFQYIACLVFW